MTSINRMLHSSAANTIPSYCNESQSLDRVLLQYENVDASAVVILFVAIAIVNKIIIVISIDVVGVAVALSSPASLSDYTNLMECRLQLSNQSNTHFPPSNIVIFALRHFT